MNPPPHPVLCICSLGWPNIEQLQLRVRERGGLVGSGRNPGRGKGTKEALVPFPFALVDRSPRTFLTILRPRWGGSCPCPHSMATQGSAERGWASGSDFHMTGVLRPHQGGHQPSSVAPHSWVFRERDCNRNLGHSLTFLGLGFPSESRDNDKHSS